MRTQFVEKGGRPQLDQPHHFVLGEFRLWESDSSEKLQASWSTNLGPAQPGTAAEAAQRDPIDLR
jgi:hypothetical protein